MLDNKYRKYKAINFEYTGIIEEDTPDFGWMLYIYKNNVNIFDSNQDSLDFCKEEAFEEFGIPMDCWEEVNE